jgi:hypothetical protein
MNDQAEREQPQPNPENRQDVEDTAMEYQLDQDQAEQVQGKLAADQLEQMSGADPDPDQQDQEALAEDKDKVIPEEQQDDGQVSKTEQQVAQKLGQDKKTTQNKSNQVKDGDEDMADQS